MLARALEIEDDETHRVKGENWFASRYASDSESDLHLDFIIHVKNH